MLRASSLGLYHNLRCISPAPCKIFLSPAGCRRSVRGKAEYVVARAAQPRPAFEVGCSTAVGFAEIAASEYRGQSAFESPGAGPSRPVRTVLEHRATEQELPEERQDCSEEEIQEYPTLEFVEMLEEETTQHDERCAAPHPDEYLPSSRVKLHRILARSKSPDLAWEAYQRLALAQQTASATEAKTIPYVHLHRLVRLLATIRPRTRTVFFRLLSVLSYLHRTGGHIKLWEWNLLIDCAGQGLRRTRPEDFDIALDVYADMIAGRAPGATFFNKNHRGAEEDELEHADETQGRAPTPDIYTYTTLLGIATRSRSKDAVRTASDLLRASGLAPSLGCHMLMMQYFAEHGDLAGMRETLAKVREQRLRLNAAAVNACIWAFVTIKRLDIAGAIYRVLRHHVVSEDTDADAELDETEGSVEEVAEHLATRESLVLPKYMVPTPATYHMLLQAYTYRGDFAHSLQVFTDMLSLAAPPPAVAPPGRPKRPFITTPSHPTLAAFRALFHGFARHGRAPPQQQQQRHAETQRAPRRRLFIDDTPSDADLGAWSAKNLDVLFAQFLALPLAARLGERMQFWIVMAYVKTTGDDARRVRRALRQLEERFGPCSGGRVVHLREKYLGAGRRRAERGRRSDAKEEAGRGHMSNAIK